MDGIPRRPEQVRAVPARPARDDNDPATLVWLSELRKFCSGLRLVSADHLWPVLGIDMSDYRRWFIPGGTYFFTVVTYDRRAILTTGDGRRILHAAIVTIRERRPFELIANVLLPDHWHLVMTLPRGDVAYSVRMKRIKEEFTTQWLAAGLPEADVTEAQRANGERGVWQPRFWEHTVRDEHDLERCVDYIHWNPRKHGLVRRVRDWPWSSFHRFVTAGQYDMDWGGTAPNSIRSFDDWGEPSP